MKILNILSYQNLSTFLKKVNDVLTDKYTPMSKSLDQLEFSELETNIKFLLTLIDEKNNEGSFDIKGFEFSRLKILQSIYGSKLDKIDSVKDEEELKNKYHFYFNFSLFLMQLNQSIRISFHHFRHYHWKQLSVSERIIIGNISKYPPNLERLYLGRVEKELLSYLIDFDFKFNHANNYLFNSIIPLIKEEAAKKQKMLKDIKVSKLIELLPFNLFYCVSKEYGREETRNVLEKLFQQFSAEDFYRLIIFSIKNNQSTYLDEIDLRNLSSVLSLFVRFKRQNLCSVKPETLTELIKELVLLCFRINDKYGDYSSYLSYLGCFTRHVEAVSNYNKEIEINSIFSSVFEDKEVVEKLQSLLMIKEPDKNKFGYSNEIVAKFERDNLYDTFWDMKRACLILLSSFNKDWKSLDITKTAVNFFKQKQEYINNQQEN